MNRGSCADCTHFDFDAGSAGYSMETPGYGWSSECSRKHFSMAGYDVTLEQYRENMRRAPDCDDFEEWHPPPPPPPPFQLTDPGLVKLVNGLALAHAVILGKPYEAGLVETGNFVVVPSDMAITKTFQEGTARWTADPVHWPIPDDGVTSFQAVAIYDPADLVVIAFQNYPHPREACKGDSITLSWGGEDKRELATMGPN